MFSAERLALLRSKDEGDAHVGASRVDVATLPRRQEGTGSSRTRHDPARVKDGEPNPFAKRIGGFNSRLAQHIEGIRFDEQVLATQAAVVTGAGVSNMTKEFGKSLRGVNIVSRTLSPARSSQVAGSTASPQESNRLPRRMQGRQQQGGEENDEIRGSSETGGVRV